MAYVYLGNCTHLPGEFIGEMIHHAEPVTASSFFRTIGSALKDAMMGSAASLQKDHSVSFLRAGKVWFFRHSGIEYVFVPRDMADKALDGYERNPRHLRKRINPPLASESVSGSRTMLGLKNYCSAKQLTDYTCGPACARSVLNFARGLDISEEQMARDCRTTSRDGTTPANMVKALWKHGLPARVATIDRKFIVWQLHQDKPVPILWGDWSEGGHWVVVIGYDPKKRTFLMADPAAKNGLRCHRWATINRFWYAKIRGKNYWNIGVVL